MIAKQQLIDAFVFAVNDAARSKQMYADLGGGSVELWSRDSNCYGERIWLWRHAPNELEPTYELKFRTIKFEIDKETFDHLNKVVKDKQKLLNDKKIIYAENRDEVAIINYIKSKR